MHFEDDEEIEQDLSCQVWLGQPVVKQIDEAKGKERRIFGSIQYRDCRACNAIINSSTGPHTQTNSVQYAVFCLCCCSGIFSKM